MPKLKQPAVRHAIVAKNLLEGKSMSRACLEAGFAPSTAMKQAGRICNSPQVVAALREIGCSIEPDHLDELARARLSEMLAGKGTDSRSLVTAIRLAFEVSGRVGPGRVQQHDHYHQFSPETLERLARRMAEIKQAQGGPVSLPHDSTALLK